MKTCWLACITVVLAVPSSPLAAEPFGVAGTDGEAACVAASGAIGPLPLRVEIIIPDPPQRVLSGTVTSALREACGALASADLEGPFFALHLDHDDKLSPGELGIARFAPDKAHAFRSCTSTEGVHLTVWAGEPLQSKRIWHRYVYLGYDTDPSCSDRDFVE